ncbi:MAG: lipoate--protein ligase [Planctomycetota bacterium]|nr:lipoate--protein ligase [Planctomycetota bacterium]
MSAEIARAPARRLDDEALDGAENMARDEALLALREAPSLRFYRWARPTLSLGWFQNAPALPLDAVRARGGAIVRRMTGGKAILHEHELTYSLCAPERGALGGGPGKAMRAIHDALATELSQQAGAPVAVRGAPRLSSDRAGSAWCFEDSSPLDLTLGDRKLLGSAARRREGWILFHGSLVLERPRENPGIAALGREPDRDALAEALGAALGYAFVPGAWSEAERQATSRVRAKYADPAFTLRR